MRKHRMFVLGAGLLALSLFAAACNDSGGDDDTGGSASASESSAPKPELTVGVSGPFAENQLVAEMYAQVLENAGYTVSRELDIADRAVGNKALERRRDRPQARIHRLRSAALRQERPNER